MSNTMTLASSLPEQPKPDPLSVAGLNEELTSLQKQREQAVANVNAIDGAIAIVKHLIEKAGQVAPAPKED